MKRLLLLPVLLATGFPLHAEPSPRQAILEKLPAYSAEQHARAVAEHEAIEAARATARAAAAADPDLLVLPDLTVQEKALQRMEEDSLYQKGAHDKELVKRELSAFDRHFLNRYTIPILGTSKEVRAREAYLERKNRLYKERIDQLSRLVALVDSDEARALRRDLHNDSATGRPITYNPRPANQR